MTTATLKVLTWNIWMMPTWVFQSPNNAGRAAAIGVELSKLDFDILCLEKAFDSGARDVIGNALGGCHPYRYGPANDAGLSLKIGSGVWVLSRIPLTDYHEIQFNESAGVESFSRKGAVLLSGAVGSHKFQIVATHLQGDDGPSYRPDYQLIRNHQMAQISSDLIEPHADKTVPRLVCGDFCTPRWDEDNPFNESDGYRTMLATFGAENGPDNRVTLDDSRVHNDLAIDNTGRAAELDYILLRSAGCAVTADWSRLVLRSRGWDGPNGRQDLSYRYGVGASVAFS